jgi:hypothetical protein
VGNAPRANDCPGSDSQCQTTARDIIVAWKTDVLASARDRTPYPGRNHEPFFR